MLEAPGFQAPEALWRLLLKRGYEAGFRAFQDAHWAGPEPETMVEVLERQGHPARAARLEVADLPFLEGPAMVELAGGTWIILDTVRDGHLGLETPAGRLTLAPEGLRGRISGRVLDLSQALPPGASLWSRLSAQFLRHRRELLLAGAATLLLQALALASPLITAVVMNRALPDGARSLLGVILAGMFLVTVQQAWIGWLRERMLMYVAARVEAAAERSFLDHALRCPFPFLQARTLGELMQAFGGFIAARDLLPVKTVGVFMNGALAFGYLGAMFWFLPLPTLLILLCTAFIAAVTLGMGRIEARLEARQVAAKAREHGLLIELVAGISTLKAAGAEAKGLGRWRRAFRQVLGLELARGRVHLWASLGLGTVGQTLSMVLLIWGGSHLLAGTLQIGTLFAYLQLSAGFMGSVQAVVQTWLTLMILKPQLAKAQEVLDQEPEPRCARPNTSEAGVAVVMEGVWFRHTPTGPWVLQDYTLKVAASGRLTLNGASGAGKTTILRLLAGLYQPERGTVLVDGSPPAQARHHILYLPQFLQVFGGSIMENLRVFSCGAPREQLLATARNTGLQTLVDALPMGYQTLVPTGGGNLSGGQRQLIALTGALASGRPLLLLDEAMANLDGMLAAQLQALIAAGHWTVVAAEHGSGRDGSGRNPPPNTPQAPR